MRQWRRVQTKFRAAARCALPVPACRWEENARRTSAGRQNQSPRFRGRSRWRTRFVREPTALPAIFRFDLASLRPEPPRMIRSVLRLFADAFGNFGDGAADEI